jgi:post-segregation antitoxin (ccd killing protein)
MANDQRRNALDRMRASPQEPLAFIPVAPLRDEKKEKAAAKRKAYDKKYPLTFFAVPSDLYETAKNIKAYMSALAHENMSTEASVSLGFVQWSLRKVRSGEFRLEGRPDAARRKMAVTLVDNDGSSWPQAQADLPSYSRTRKPKPQRIGWRWPADVKAQIKAIANDSMPEGDVAIRLLEYAMNKVKNGGATIKISPMDVRQVVSLDDKWPH